MQTEFLCISVLRVASGPRVKLAGCKSALNLMVVYSTDHSKTVVPMLVLLFDALCFFYEPICFKYCLVLFCSCVFFSVLLALRFPCLGKRKIILVPFVCLFDLRLFGFLVLMVSGEGCGLWFWHSLNFSLTFFARVSSHLADVNARNKTSTGVSVSESLDSFSCYMIDTTNWSLKTISN